MIERYGCEPDKFDPLSDVLSRELDTGRERRQAEDWAKEAEKHAQAAAQSEEAAGAGAGAAAEDAKEARANAEAAKKEADRAREYADEIDVDHDYIERAVKDAQDAEEGAAKSKTGAEEAKAAAELAAGSAGTAATTAGGYADTAGQAASAAAGSADQAGRYASTADKSATAAKTSETNAGKSATAAKTSETNADKSATAAKTSETNAGKSADAAKASADKAEAIVGFDPSTKQDKLTGMPGQVVGFAYDGSAVAAWIGGRNLVLDSGVSYSGIYEIHLRYKFSKELDRTKTYTVSLKGQLSSGNQWMFYDSPGLKSFISLNSNDLHDGVYKKTFTIAENINFGSDNKTFHLYTTSTASETSTVEWIKIEEGRIATDWTPAPEDMQTKLTFPLSIEQGGTGNTTGTAQYLESHQLWNKDGIDLNDYITPGFYWYSSSEPPLNGPNNYASLGLIVYRSAGGFYNQIASNGNDVYIRYRDGTGTWYSWHRFYTDAVKPTASDITFADGQTLQQKFNAGTLSAIAQPVMLDDTDSLKKLAEALKPYLTT